MSVQEKAISCAEMFLNRKGYEVIDRNFVTEFGTIDLVFEDFDENDDKVVVFTEVRYDNGKFPELPIDRNAREQQAASWLIATDADCFAMRFDNIDFNILANEKAILRHHINSLGDTAVA